MALVGCVRVSSQRCTWSGRGITADVNADPVPMRDALGIEQQNHVLLACRAARCRPKQGARELLTLLAHLMANRKRTFDDRRSDAG